METSIQITSKPPKKHKKLKIILIIITVLLLLLASFLLASRYMVKSKLDKMNHVTIPKDAKSLGINENTYKNTDSNTATKTEAQITNILLLGTDTRDIKSDPGRSDSMMVLTIDKKSKKLKVTSIMRDSIVSVDGHGERKLTEAHAFGGALLTLKTINENYNLNIKDYIQVNFVGLSKIIDYIGGVPINVTSAEVPYANSCITEIANMESIKPTPITSPGMQNLNGMQAVGYARIRYVGNSDFQRTERQRTVLSAIFKKLSTTNVTSISGVADTLAPYVETSLKSDDILSLGTYMLTNNMTSFEQDRVPYDGMWQNAKINGGDGLSWDKQPTIDKLHKFIFGNDSN